MQEDYVKRVHYNGGSCSKLQPRGIVILGRYSSHGRIAEALGSPRTGLRKVGECDAWLPVPTTGKRRE